MGPIDPEILIVLKRLYKLVSAVESFFYEARHF